MLIAREENCNMNNTVIIVLGLTVRRATTNLSEAGQRRRCRRGGGATVRISCTNPAGGEGGDAIGYVEGGGTAQQTMLLVQVGNCRREGGRPICIAPVPIEVAGVAAIDVHGGCVE